MEVWTKDYRNVKITFHREDHLEQIIQIIEQLIYKQEGSEEKIKETSFAVSHFKSYCLISGDGDSGWKRFSDPLSEFKRQGV